MDLATIFARTARDEASTVRRSALSLFDAALPAVCSQKTASVASSVLHSEAVLSHFDLDLLGRLASDESVLVRRAAIGSISLLLRTCPMEVSALLWVGHVLPLVFDPESSVVERAV